MPSSPNLFRPLRQFCSSENAYFRANISLRSTIIKSKRRPTDRATDSAGRTRGDSSILIAGTEPIPFLLLIHQVDYKVLLPTYPDLRPIGIPKRPAGCAVCAVTGPLQGSNILWVNSLYHESEYKIHHS
ncbi:hypothetical protein ABKN59_011414 [Abortiporus biennis]